MKVRIEFVQSDTPSFKKALTRCLKMASFKKIQREGVAVYCVGFAGADLDEFDAIHGLVLSCEQVVVYIDENRIDTFDAFDQARGALEEDRKKSAAVDDLLRQVREDKKKYL